MGQKSSPREVELYRRCDEILHYLWDPIGVAGSPGARDEYEAYLPRVFAFVRDDAEPEAVVSYLVAIQEQRMQLPADRERVRNVVARLFEWREWIWDRT